METDKKDKMIKFFSKKRKQKYKVAGLPEVSPFEPMEKLAGKKITYRIQTFFL